MKAKNTFGVYIKSLLVVSLIYDSPNIYSQQAEYKMFYDKDKSIKIDETYTQSTEIFPFNEKSIFSLGISADVLLESDTSYVRIILVDDNGTEYLVLETNRIYEYPETTLLADFSEETSILDAVVPYSLILQINSSSVKLSSVSVNTKPKTRLKSDDFQRTKKQLKVKQDSIKIYKLNRWIDDNNMKWIAGETSISKMTFEEKRKLFKDGIVPNMNGFEYYVGGIFETNPMAQDIEFRITEGVVSSFDWRNIHGQNWMTSVKNQGGCGSCAIFAVTGATEALINLYYNQHIDRDLAEQLAVSCVSGNCENGWYPSAIIDYYINTGVINEACFPYHANDTIRCGDSCNSPAERIRVSGRVGFPSTGHPRIIESLQHMIIEFGPLSGGIVSWGHAMTLVGFSTDVSDSSIVWIFKNSWGSDWGENGYANVKVPISDIGWTHAIQTPILSRNLNTTDIVCTDNDGDGYYFWGIGIKPAHCPPSNAMPDGDDSNADIGPMDGDGTFSKTLPYSFSFENNLTEWWQSNLDSINWSFCSGSTPSSNTGPSSAFDGEYYLYLEASNPNNPNKQAILISPTMDLLNLCNIGFSFYYHMYGANTGDLSLQVSTDGGDTWSSDVWTLSGNQGDSWYQANIDLSSYSGQLIKVRFIGTTGNGYASDIAIDNVIISSTLSSAQTVTTTQTWADYRSVCGHLTIQNGAKLTITGTTVLPYQANITVKNNSELIVDKGNVINSNIIVESGGKLTLKNNGVIVQNSDETTINTGGLFDFLNGEIKIVNK